MIYITYSPEGEPSTGDQGAESDASDGSKDYTGAVTYRTGSAQPQSGSEGPISFAFDNDTSTYWHSEWTPSWSTSQMQQYLWVEFMLEEATVVDAIRYLARPGGGNGDITGYRVEGTTDGTTWETLTTGTWDRLGQVWQLAEFEATEVAGLRLVATSTYADSGNNRFASAAELRVRTYAAPADKTALKDTVAAAEALNEADYTADSWEALVEALEEAEIVILKTSVEQEEVTAVAEMLQSAMDNLVEVDPTPGPEPEPEPDPTPGPEVCEVFTDVKHNAWYEISVQYVYDKGLMSGNDGLFKPTENVTRAQLVTTLYRLAGSPEVTDYSACDAFSDVKAGKYYTDAVCWAYNTGVGTGNNGKFDTTGNLARQQLAAFLFRFAETMGYDVTARADYSSMLNADKVSSYAKEAMQWAVGSGLISGSDKTVNGVAVKDLNPKGTTTRAQLAAILQRFCENNGI